MGWTVRGSNPGEGQIFCTVQTGKGARRAFCTMDTWSLFQGVKRLERVVDYSPHPSLRLKKEYSCTATPLLVLQWPVLRWNLLLLLLAPKVTFELWLLLNVVVTLINSPCCWVWYVADLQSVVSTQQPFRHEEV